MQPLANTRPAEHAPPAAERAWARKLDDQLSDLLRAANSGYVDTRALTNRLLTVARYLRVHDPDAAPDCWQGPQLRECLLALPCSARERHRVYLALRLLGFAVGRWDEWARALDNGPWTNPFGLWGKALHGHLTEIEYWASGMVCSDADRRDFIRRAYQLACLLAEQGDACRVSEWCPDAFDRLMTGRLGHLNLAERYQFYRAALRFMRIMGRDPGWQHALGRRAYAQPGRHGAPKHKTANLAAIELRVRVGEQTPWLYDLLRRGTHQDVTAVLEAALEERARAAVAAAAAESPAPCRWPA